MYGREVMYLRGKPESRNTAISRAAEKLSRRNHVLTQRHGSNINPRIATVALADESELVNPDLPRPIETCPALTGDFQYLARCLHRVYFHDGEVRHVRPLLVIVQPFDVEPVMQFANPVCAKGHADKHRGCDRHEVFHVAKGNFKGHDRATNPLDKRNRFGFRAVESARRQNGDVSRQVSVGRMQFRAQVLDEFSEVVPDVSDQSVLAWRSHEMELYAHARNLAVRYNHGVGA